MISILLFALSTTFAIVWSLMFLPLGKMGYKMHRITGMRMKTFLKKVKYASIWTNDEPDGWVCGMWYFGYIHTSQSGTQGGITTELYLFCSEIYYKSDVELKETSVEGKTTKITYYEREGDFWRLKYTSRPIDLPKKPIRMSQSLAVNKIIETYDNQNYCRCLIYGRPGTGKSWTGLYLSQKLLETKKEVFLVDTFNPFDHNDQFTSLYNKINPTQDKPLVVMLEEIDGNITKMHNGQIEQKEHLPIQIKNKGDWNGFLDRFDRELYPYVIIVLTSNKSITYFDDLDPSYMRNGRIDHKIELN